MPENQWRHLQRESAPPLRCSQSKCPVIKASNHHIYKIFLINTTDPVLLFKPIVLKYFPTIRLADYVSIACFNSCFKIMQNWRITISALVAGKTLRKVLPC